MNASTDGLGVRPFNARSLVLSVLLGLPDPRLGRPAAFRLADLFGIAPGTMRTALSRLVAGGERDRRRPRLRADRPAARTQGGPGHRATLAAATWDGSWWVVLVTVANRDVGDAP